MALFSAGTATQARDVSKNIVEFKAGKLSLKGTKVVPDKRKGTFYIHREKDTMLTHVCWKDRTSGVVEDDLIVFPDDCEWKKVSQCTTGRVYLLRFTSSNRKLFFWMQEPKDVKDEEFATKINKALNEPDDASGNDMMSNVSGSNPEQILAQMLSGGGGGSQEQLLQQFLQTAGFGGMGGGGSGGGTARATSGGSSAAASGGASRPTAAEATTQPTTATGLTDSATSRPVSTTPPTAIQMADFQSIMSSLGALPKPPRSGDSPGATDLAAGLPLSSSSLQTSDADTRARLEPHLPTDANLDMTPANELSASLASPQFRQALSGFSHAFNTGQLAPVIGQFDLGADAQAAATRGDLSGLVQALNTAAGGSNEGMETDAPAADADKPEHKDEEKKDEDHPME